MRNSYCLQFSLQYGELTFFLFFALSINHQLEQQGKSHLRFYYVSFHISMDRSTREISERVTATYPSPEIATTSLPGVPTAPFRGVLFPRSVDRALGRKQPLVSGLIAAELSSLLWLHPSLPQIIRLGECRWTYLPLLIFHCCWKTNEIISEKPLEETWCINLEWHYRWDITLIILPPAIRQDVFVLF